MTVVFNGEIYNYRELQRELESLGHRYQTYSDTESIVHAYEESELTASIIFGACLHSHCGKLFIAIHNDTGS